MGLDQSRVVGEGPSGRVVKPAVEVARVVNLRSPYQAQGIDPRRPPERFMMIPVRSPIAFKDRSGDAALAEGGRESREIRRKDGVDLLVCASVTEGGEQVN